MLRPPLPRNESTFTTNWFKYSHPIEPIAREGFIGATWGDVDPPSIMGMSVRGIDQRVEVFGFQALRGNREMPASIIMHPEPKQTELTYIIQGEMNMAIQTPGEHPVTSHMQGPLPQEIDLQKALFCVREDGTLIISVDNVEYISPPTVTPVGSSHGTTPVSDECTYFVIKVSQ